MNASPRLRRGLFWVGSTILAIAALCVLAAVALDAGYLRGPLLKLLAAYSGRPIRVEGRLSLHIFSSSPRLVGRRRHHRQSGVDARRERRGSRQGHGGIWRAALG